MKAHEVPIRLWSLGTYRRFSSSWWLEILRFVAYGWFGDACRLVHRARYGWASGDAINASDYLNGVIGGVLVELGRRPFGAPCGYPSLKPEIGEDGEYVTNFEKWEEDPLRWGAIFADASRDDLYELHGRKPDFKDWHADEDARNAAVHVALKEIEPWWGALWS